MAVILRLYNRVADCVVNVDLISRLWKSNDYYIIVVSNGCSEGFCFPNDVKFDGEIVKLQENLGHFKGNSQLLTEGAKHIPDECEYAVLLESDTWLMDDGLINKYIGKLDGEEKKVWASANWIDKYHSLATDFAIVKTSFIKENPGVFGFDGGAKPEISVYNYISDNGFGFYEIDELYPVHLPKIIPFGPQVYGKRRKAFPRGPMVTHHLENIGNSIERKKALANMTCGKKVFDTEGRKSKIQLRHYRAYLILFQRLLRLAPKSRWFKGRKKG
ncbi:MAG: hypothetical protein V3S46_09995 [Nitrospinota bacterium]